MSYLYDLLELKDALERCDQSETIVLASSKSFTTSEVLKNLAFVKEWFQNTGGTDYLDQLFGVSSDAEAMNDLGIKKGLLVESNRATSTIAF